MKKFRFIFAWILCGIISYGGLYASITNTFPTLDSPQNRAENSGFCFLVALSGPVGIVAVTGLTGFYFHGLQYSGGPKKKGGAP